MKTKLAMVALVALIAWGLKRHYADARADDLWWILKPTARVVSIATGTAFIMTPGEGYVSRERLFVIEKSCAGINFMIAAFDMLAFVLGRRAGCMASGLRALAISLVGSYVAAVLVNATRITIAMWLAAHPVARSSLGAAQLHRLEGIAVYFGGLMLLYELARRFGRSEREVVQP